MGTPTVPTPPPDEADEPRVVSSGLYVNAADCEYCQAWSRQPCAFHDYGRTA